MDNDAWSHIIKFTDAETAMNLGLTSRTMQRLTALDKLTPQTIHITEEMYPMFRHVPESKHDVTASQDACNRAIVEGNIPFLQSYCTDMFMFEAVEVALNNNRLDVIQYIIDTYPQDLDLILRAAVQKNAFSIVSYLVEDRKVDVDECNAVLFANTTVMLDYLLEHGANAYDALYNAVNKNRVHLLEHLAYLINEDVLIYAVLDSNYDMIDYILGQGIHVTDRVLAHVVDRDMYDYLSQFR